MVLTSFISSTSSGLRSQIINALRLSAFSNIACENIFTLVCKDCQKTAMAAIPPSTFSAATIRETQRNITVSKKSITKGNESPKFFNTNLLELTPVKYNSMLMNSIWSFYNRYSPHNVKKVSDVFPLNAELQQSTVSSANEAKITLQTANLDNVWINVSQSH